MFLHNQNHNHRIDREKTRWRNHTKKKEKSEPFIVARATTNYGVSSDDTYATRFKMFKRIARCVYIWCAATVKTKKRLLRTRQRCKHKHAVGMIQPLYLWYDDYLLIYEFIFRSKSKATIRTLQSTSFFLPSFAHMLSLPPVFEVQRWFFFRWNIKMTHEQRVQHNFFYFVLFSSLFIHFRFTFFVWCFG